MIAIVDTGPLYAAIDADDADHDACAAVLSDPSLRLVVPALVVAETSYLVGTRLGADVEAAFLRGLVELDVDAPEPDEWPRLAELVVEYGDFTLGATDASVVALAERPGTDVIVTLDHRHFRAVRPRHCAALRLLP